MMHAVHDVMPTQLIVQWIMILKTNPIHTKNMIS